MSIYNADWQDVPSGYYADPIVRANHHRRLAENALFDQLVEQKLELMGYRVDEIPTQNDIEQAEESVREYF
jgi:hypothetical protein